MINIKIEQPQDEEPDSGLDDLHVVGIKNSVNKVRTKMQENLQRSQPRSQARLNPPASDVNPVVSKRSLEKYDSASVDRGITHTRPNMLLSSPQSQSEKI